MSMADWSKLPPKLAYLASPAENYGGYQFDDRIYEFLRQMSDSQRIELSALNDRMAQDERIINGWLDEYPMTEHAEARLVYFLGHLLAIAYDNGFFSTR